MNSAVSSIVTSRSSSGISRISALAKVVLPEPVSPVAITVFRARIARGKKASQSRAWCSVRQLCIERVRPKLRHVRSREQAARRQDAEGRGEGGGAPIVRLIVPAVTAGGRQICTRCPSGSVEAQSGRSGPTSCCDIAAQSVAMASSRLKSSSGTSCHVQAPRRSTPASPGRLTTTSVVVGSASGTAIGASSSRRVRSPGRLTESLPGPPWR